MVRTSHDTVWLHLLLCVLTVANGFTLPFFGLFRQTPPGTSTVAPVPGPTPTAYHFLRDQRIINADHGGVGVPFQPSYAGGNVGHSPWISGTKDQFIRDQLVVLHPDSPLNREAWKESGYLNPDFDPTPRKTFNASSIPNPNAVARSTPPSSSSSSLRARKLHRKAKQHPQQQQEQTNVVKQEQKVANDAFGTPSVITNQNNYFPQNNFQQGDGGLYEMPAPVLFRENNVAENENGGIPIISTGEPILYGNDLFIPITAPVYPYHARTALPQQPLPQEAVIQLLKSPEQELSPSSRPQIKLPFPLSHDCSASGGGGSRPLQFVVLPIVEPVAPLKPIFPKPSFLSSQYGQFPYVPPFNLFKKPPVPPSQDAVNNGGGSGQFVPILNRPAPPLPFVFVQSLPLELIGQNLDMDVIHSAAPTTTSENKVKDVPVAAPLSQSQPNQPTPVQPNVSAPSRETFPPIHHSNSPLPLIVIEKVKNGQPPSPAAPAATVVEISKQSIPKTGSSGSSPLSTISVVQPISAPGGKPVTFQQHQAIQKTIEKLVPVAAAVLENVEQQKQQKVQGRDRDISNSNPDDASVKATPQAPATVENDKNSASPEASPSINHATVTSPKEQQKTPLRPSLRPEVSQDSTGGLPPVNANVHNQHKRPDISSSEETGTGSTTLTEVEVTEA